MKSERLRPREVRATTCQADQRRRRSTACSPAPSRQAPSSRPQVKRSPVVTHPNSSSCRRIRASCACCNASECLSGGRHNHWSYERIAESWWTNRRVSSPHVTPKLCLPNLNLLGLTAAPCGRARERERTHTFPVAKVPRRGSDGYQRDCLHHRVAARSAEPSPGTEGQSAACLDCQSCSQPGSTGSEHTWRNSKEWR